MKLLHILGDSKFGGGSIIVLRLAQRAKKEGWEVHVLTTDPIFQEILTENNITFVSLEVIWRNIRPIRDLIGLIKLYRFLRNSDYDIIHTHTTKAGFVGRLAGKLAKVPVIIHTAHGFAFHERSNPVIMAFFSLLERLASYWCDKIVAVSNFHKDLAIKLHISKDSKIIAIPNGLDENRIKVTKDIDEIYRELGINKDYFIILTTGRLAVQKGIEYLIRSIPYVKARIEKPFKVLIVGDGPLKIELLNLSERLNVKEYVKFLGFRKDIGDLLHIADVVVLPSLWEGLSISLLEAMAAGKAIITTDVSSNREVLRDSEGYAGMIVPPRDPKSLASAIAYLYNNESFREKMGERARKVYEQRYTEERMLSEYIKLYKFLYNDKVKQL